MHAEELTVQVWYRSMTQSTTDVTCVCQTHDCVERPGRASSSGEWARVRRAERGYLAGADGMEGVGQQQDGVPEWANAVPGRRYAVLPIAQDHRLHRRTRQERARLEGQQAHAICCCTLDVHIRS